MSHIFPNKDARLKAQQEDLLGQSLTNLAWLHHLNVGTIIAPCVKYEDPDDKRPSKLNLLKLPNPRQIARYSKNRSLKPPYSYVILIGLAFRYLKCDRLTSDQITNYIIKDFPFFQSTNIEDHVKETLQQNKLFERVRKRKDESYSGIFWRLSDSVVVRSDSDMDENSGINFVDKKKRSSSVFSTESYLMEDEENYKKFRSRSTEFSGNKDDFDYNFPGDDFLNEYNWDTLMGESKETNKTGGKYSDDWFPPYEGRDPIYGQDSLSDFNGTSPGFEGFEDSKNLYEQNSFMGGYCEAGDLSDFTSAIHFDPLLSSSWGSDLQESEFGSMGGQGYRFGREGV